MTSKYKYLTNYVVVGKLIRRSSPGGLKIIPLPFSVFPFSDSRVDGDY